jgi:hypothetical protein
MTDLDSLLLALAEPDVAATDVARHRSNEARCLVPAGGVPALGALACGRFGAHLLLMAGEDRRRDDHAFVVHYVFGHPRGGWILDAATRLDPARPEVPSLGPFLYPASRFERAPILRIVATSHRTASARPPRLLADIRCARTPSPPTSPTMDGRSVQRSAERRVQFPGTRHAGDRAALRFSVMGGRSST